MELLRIIIKICIVLAMVLLMALPFVLEFSTFRSDKEKKISYKRFRVLVYTGIYILAVTLVLYLLKEILLGIETLSFVKWTVSKLAISKRSIYFTKVLSAILVNVAIGVGFVFFSKFVRIGMQKSSVTEPKKKGGKFSLAQRIQRSVIKFFHTETWFFVGTILKWLSILLSTAYALVFIAYQLPAMFGASFLPYGFFSMLFDAGYIYPTISLLGLWEAYFFLEGIKRLEDECPELMEEETQTVRKQELDLKAIDDEVRLQFSDYHACDLDISSAVQENIYSTEHSYVTKMIAQAVENDTRNPQSSKEAYLNCLDKLAADDKNIIINGNFFSEFSMYFVRYLGLIMARGDNVVLVCNSDSQIEQVYDYLMQGLSEVSSLYCEGFENEAIDFDHPIWRVSKVMGEENVVDEAYVDDSNILVTSLSYLCSTRFENQHANFISLIDAVIFVDTLNTVNTYNRQLAILNTRLKHVAKVNSLKAKNSSEKELFRMRYASRAIRYICFDDTRVSGLDKVMTNMMDAKFEAADAMHYNPATIVRCYRYEGKLNAQGRRSSCQFVKTEEELGALINMAQRCLEMGAGNVSIFIDNIIPYKNFAESLFSNMAQISFKVDDNSIRLNKRNYNPDDYSVIIAMDSDDNLPATLRRYLSMASDKPTLVMVFSRPYMLRDYYLSNLESIWSQKQIARIPVEEGTKKDIAQRILVKANAGGITQNEILNLAGGVPAFAKYVEKKDVNGILRGVLEEYGVTHNEGMSLFRYFEYTSLQDFDENGKYNSQIKIVLRRQGKLFEVLNGRNMVVMVVGDSEIVLPVPRGRLTQNYIAGQNLVHNGNIYYIQKIDVEAGRIYARLAVGGKNDETYQYVQDRLYRMDLSPEQIEYATTKHVVLDLSQDDVSVKDVYVSAFRVPTEVVTKGYYEVDPHSLARNCETNIYHSIGDAGNDVLAKQTYRQYGNVKSPYYDPDNLRKSAYLNKHENGALAMTVRVAGKCGPNRDKTVTLAAAMLHEILSSMFPSVADSIAVCPVLQNNQSDCEDTNAVMKRSSKVEFIGKGDLISDTDFEIMIIEDAPSDLGVVAILMSAGDNVLRTLFGPVFEYLQWYLTSDTKSDYLRYGLDHEPKCFDFASLHKLAMLLGDDKHDIEFRSTEVECTVCDFCGKKYRTGDGVVELDDGRRMCKSCAENLVGNNKKILKAHLERAKIYLESTYGITLDNDYDFCFESTVKIVNTLKQNRELFGRGSDAPLKSYVDGKKKVHVEYSVPSANLSELLVRELTHVWQLKHLPEIPEDLAEGHIALVGIQYLRFLNQKSLASARTNYYESTSGVSGIGYRKLVSELVANPSYRNNPFTYLLQYAGGEAGDETKRPTPKPTPKPRVIDPGEYGQPYTPEKPDRVSDGSIKYFYYERLTASRQKVYNDILEAARAHRTEVEVPSCTSEEIKELFYMVTYDHPELFWLRWIKWSSQKPNVLELLYGATAEEAALLQKQIDEVVPKYLEGIDDSMSAYDVALRLHAKMIGSVDYDTVALRIEEGEGGPATDKIDYLRSICGVFLNGKAVCEGYARAMQYLLQKCGVECAEAAGYIRKENGVKGGGHAWNILKLDGDYYYLDTTWDDSSNTVQTVKSTDIGFKYFAITTEELCRSRDLEMCYIQMPSCTATRCNYYYHNDYVLSEYDLEKIKDIARIAAKNKIPCFTFKCADEELLQSVINTMFNQTNDGYEAVKAAAKIDKRIQSNYCWSYDTNIYTITISFKYE